MSQCHENGQGRDKQYGNPALADDVQVGTQLHGVPQYFRERLSNRGRAEAIGSLTVIRSCRITDVATHVDSASHMITLGYFDAIMHHLGRFKASCRQVLSVQLKRVDKLAGRSSSSPELGNKDGLECSARSTTCSVSPAMDSQGLPRPLYSSRATRGFDPFTASTQTVPRDRHT